MEKYRLLPIQVESLKKQYNEIIGKLVELNVLKKEEFADLKAASGAELNTGLDSSFLNSLQRASGAFHDVRNKLKYHEILEPSNSDTIELGSSFEATIDYGDEVGTEVFTLVQIINAGDNFNFISASSPLGEAVLGKNSGDEFQYSVNQNHLKGKINSIIKENQKTL